EGTLVVGFEDAVAVVVELRTTVVAFEAVFVLGNGGTRIASVGDTVTIIVGVRTTIVVFEAIFVFNGGGTCVARVGDAVTVAVGHRSRRGYHRRGCDGAVGTKHTQHAIVRCAQPAAQAGPSTHMTAPVTGPPT